MTSPGVHAFLIILRVDRFSPEEKNTVDFIKTIFGAGAAKYCVVIFTRQDQLEEGQTIDEFISSSDELQELVNSCGNRKLALNNKLNGEQLDRVTRGLLQIIDQMVQRNNGNYYTNAEYQRIEKERREEQARRDEQERRKKKEYEDSLVASAREDERKRGEKREQEERDRRCRMNQNYDDDDGSLFDGMRQMMLGNRMPYQSSMSTSSRNPGGSGGRFTGEFMATRGSANNRPIMEGSRGGQFYYNANGNKTYLRK
ncbi:unnamed protein product [Rotaria sp. Silwood2]|nr:unnamed protein product [Rotaria sp. Silwood2]